MRRRYVGLRGADEGYPWGLRPLSQLTAASRRWIFLRSCANGPYGDHFVRHVRRYGVVVFGSP